MLEHIGRNIKAIRTDQGLSQAQLAEVAHVSQSTVSAWERSETSPTIHNVEMLVTALPELDSDAVLSSERGFVSRMLHGDEHFSHVPLYEVIPFPAADAPKEAEHVAVPSSIVRKHPSCYFVPMQDESMNLRLPQGVYVMIDPDAPIGDGEVGAVSVKGAAPQIRRLVKLNNGVKLLPDSADPTFHPQVVDFDRTAPEDFACIGRAVWFCAPESYAI